MLAFFDRGRGEVQADDAFGAAAGQRKRVSANMTLQVNDVEASGVREERDVKLDDIAEEHWVR